MAKGSSSPLLRLVLVLAGLGLLGAAVLASALPRAGAERVEVTPEVVGVHDGQSYAWVVRTPKGAFLVDTGGDVDGARLRRELTEQGLGLQDVHAVLLTHGHKDHWGAAHLFPNATVYVGPGEEALLLGLVRLRAPAARVFTEVVPAPPLPRKVVELTGDEVLELDGEKVQVVHLPGHTAGSMAFLWRDVVFTGDSLVGGDREELRAAPWIVTEDGAKNRASLQKLVGLAFTRVCDGHTGLTGNARAGLRALLAE